VSIWSRLERRITDIADGLVLDEHRDQVSQARTLIESGNTVQAIELLEALLVVKPEHGQALTALGSAYLSLQDASKRNAPLALATFERAVAARPGDPDALLGLGLAQLAMALFEPAIANCSRAVAEAGGNRALLASAYRCAGIAWRHIGDVDKAIRELRKAVAEDANDREARAALGEAMAEDGDGSDEPERQLQRSVADATAVATHSGVAAPPPITALYALGKIALSRGQATAADAFLTDAQSLSAIDLSPLGRKLHTDILIGLGQTALILRDPTRAHMLFLQSLQYAPGRADVHAKLARTHYAVGNREAALSSFDIAISLAVASAGADSTRHSAALLSIVQDAVDLAIACQDAQRQLHWGGDLLVRQPDNVRGVTARGLATATLGDPETARSLLELAVHRGDIDAHVGLAMLDVGNAPTRALHVLSAALRVDPHHGGARKALSVVLHALYPEPISSDVAVVGAALEATLASRSELAHLVGDTARATAEIDSPLLVTVMGEFSSGKSSFVNALIGSEVAMTGITPTTATINVVRYGHHEHGTIHYSAAAARQALDLPWQQLFAHLRSLSANDTKLIDRVEIFVPLPQLEKINIVDTPGLNSIQPEHEATARAFIARADAVVWVFTANQGGKASERKALTSIASEGKRVLGVLNKADQLSASEVIEVQSFVAQSLSGLVETVVPFSARRALQSKLSPPTTPAPSPSDTSIGIDGNWQTLHQALEQRFFLQARQLKRDAWLRKGDHCAAAPRVRSLRPRAGWFARRLCEARFPGCPSC
jgi:tetratricopeptide (TPR) repeat protein